MPRPNPPQHLLDELRIKNDEISSLQTNISDLEKTKATKEESLHLLELYIESSYGWKRPHNNEVVKSVQHNQKRRIEKSEYKSIIVPFLLSKNPVFQAKSKEIREEVSAKVGFDVSEDSISKALREMHKLPDVPVWQIQAGIYGYSESNPRVTHQ